MITRCFTWIGSLSMLVLLACSGGNVAGGTSEETNAVAGVFVDESGKPIANAIVEARASDEFYQDAIVLQKQTNAGFLVNVVDRMRDTTDAEGRWSISIDTRGAYTVFSHDSSGRMNMRQLNVTGKMNLLDTMKPSVAWAANVLCRSSIPQGVMVVIPGTSLHATTDSVGRFRFDALPQGRIGVKILSADPYRFADIMLTVDVYKEQAVKAWGPFGDGTELDSLQSLQMLTANQSNTADTIVLPLLYEYGLRARWSFDELDSSGDVVSFIDLQGRAGDAMVYGASSVKGVYMGGLELQGSDQFGVVEDPGTALDSLDKFSVEMWFRLDSMPKPSAYQMNLFGQLGMGGANASDLFSIALVRDSLKSPAVAFFLNGDAKGVLDTADRVVSSAKLTVGEWMHVVATWDGTQECIYVNGGASNCRTLGITAIATSSEPLYFGKENMHVVLDEIRIINVNLNEVDARYRWLRRLR